jgi:23S rRNA G2445 N2-methylase RlmL
MKSFQGIEIDPEVVKKVSKNTQNLIINEGDFFKSSFQAPSILILNPPYGKRIKIPGKKTSYFLKIISHIKDNFGPKRFGMIIPYDASIHIKSDQRLPFNQNGIQVEFLIFDSK